MLFFYFESAWAADTEPGILQPSHTFFKNAKKKSKFISITQNITRAMQKFNAKVGFEN